MKLRVSYEIETDGDPSSVLDGAIEALSDLLANVEATGVEATGDENEIFVEEVTA